MATEPDVTSCTGHVPKNARPDRWIWWVAIAFMSATSLPYVFGAAMADGRAYTGFHYNADDFCVYAAWMRQAEQGRFLFDNRFTTDPQPGLTIHLFFWALGTLQRFTHLTTPLVIHAARWLFGLLAIVTFYRLSRKLLAPESASRLAAGLFLFASGLGWLMWPSNEYGWGFGTEAPADTWQPELMGFTLLYFNPLFAVSAWLMLQILNSAIDAERSWRPVVTGALCALLLANIHTYDVFTLACIAAAWTLARAIQRAGNWVWLLRVAVIAAGAILSLAWLAYVLSVDPVFRARAATLADVEPLWKYLLGFGLLIPLAIAGIALALRPRSSRTESRHAFTQTGRALLPAWAFVGFVMPFLSPIQPRKLWMGEQWPLCLLAAATLWFALSRFPPRARRLTVLLTLLILVPTNVLWVYRDALFLTRNQSNTGLHTPYLSPAQMEVIRWLSRNTSPTDAVIAPPNFACFIAALAGNPVYVGHWSETPDFATKFGEVNLRLLTSGAPDAERQAIVAKSRARYIVNLDMPIHGPDGREMFDADLSAFGPVVFENAEWRIYRVTEPPGGP